MILLNNRIEWLCSLLKLRKEIKESVTHYNKIEFLFKMITFSENMSINWKSTKSCIFNIFWSSWCLQDEWTIICYKRLSLKKIKLNLFLNFIFWEVSCFNFVRLWNRLVTLWWSQNYDGHERKFYSPATEIL